MLRPSPAARRFYRAFYHWNTLSHSVPQRRLPACRNSLHTSTRLTSEGIKQDDHATPRVQSFAAEGPSRRQTTSGRSERRVLSLNNKGQPTSLGRGIPVRWQRGPVLTSDQRPFDALYPGHDVVRHRSDSGLMVEVAVLGNTVEAAQKLYGNQFEQLVTRHGARVEHQDIRKRVRNDEQDTSENTLHSILISGTFHQVKKVYDGIINAEHNLVQLRDSSTISSNEPLGPSINTPKAWLISPVLSTTQHPSSHLRPSDLVVRERSQNFIKLDIALPQPRLEQLRSHYGSRLEVLQSRYSTTVDVHTFSDFSDGGSNDSVVTPRHVVTLSGPFPGVERAFDALRLPGTTSLGRQERAQPSEYRAEKHTEDHPSPLEALNITSQPHSHVSFVDLAEPHSNHTAIPIGKRRWNFNVTIEGQQAKFVRDRVVGQNQSEILKLQEDAKCYFVSQRRNNIRGKGSRPSVDAFVTALKERILESAEKIETEIKVITAITAETQDNTNDRRSTKASLTTDIQGDLDPEETVQLGEDVRTVLRGLTHPVVLVTSREVDAKDSPYHGAQLVHSRGITVSSFNTVTLQPQPIISFNVKTPSRTWDAIKSSERLRVHLLCANGKGAAIADVFTKPYERAHEGFHHLEDMGADVLTFQGKVPPRVFLKDGTLAQLRATLLPDRCIEISDHIIVVARVDSCKFTDESGLKSAAEMGSGVSSKMSALSYAKKGYRGIGTQVDLAHLPAKDSRTQRKDNVNEERERKPKTTIRKVAHDGPLAVVETGKVKPSSERPRNEHPQHVESNAGPSFAAPYRDPIYNVLRGTRDAAREGYSVDINQLWNEADQELSKEAQEEEDDYDFGFDRPQYDSARGRSLPQHEKSRLHKGTEASDVGELLWGPEDLAREESGRLGSDRKAQNAFNLGALRGGEDESSHRSPDTNESKPLRGPGTKERRLYSTSSRFATPGSRMKRSFSTISRLLQEGTDDWADVARVVEPAALKTTVADYLGVPDNNMPSKKHPVRSLIKMNDIAREAERRLQEEKDQLSEEEVLQLQQDVRINDRIVTRKLAWNAADDLRLMLDKGRVDFKRAQFLESMIEKGQALLLEDAKHARQLLQQGKVNEHQFQTIKLRLENDHATLVTETNRLRQFVDEEG